MEGITLYRSDRAVPPGSPLRTKEGKPVTRVLDVIGPVSAPYICVRGCLEYGELWG